MKEENKVRGALYGVAVGDALGGPVEFMDAAEIRKLYGSVQSMVGGGVWDLMPGETTDDTAMTMAVAKGIVKAPRDPVPQIGKLFLEWYYSRPKDIGNQTIAVLSAATSEKTLTRQKWHSIAEAERCGKTMGNGALMRTVYPPLYYDDLSAMQKHVGDIAKMTHISDESTELCVNYSTMVYHAIRGKVPGFEDVSAENVPPSGYVHHTYVNALQAIARTGSFRDAVVDAVNRGGDADTIGAVTGGLAGAIYGYDAIPEEWVNSLAGTLRQDMDRLVAAAFEGRRQK